MELLLLAARRSSSNGSTDAQDRDPATRERHSEPEQKAENILHVGHLLRCQSAFLAVDRLVVRFLDSGTGSEIGFIISNA